MHDDLSILDGDPVARLDQQLAVIRGSGKIVNAYLEGLENENIPEALHEPLVLQMMGIFWQNAFTEISEPPVEG